MVDPSGGVVASLVLLEWAVGWIAVAAWSQSWSVVRRGHFRITAWIVVALAGAALVVQWSSVSLTDLSGAAMVRHLLVAALVVACLLYLLVQFSNTDLPGTVMGYVAALVGIAVFVVTARLLGSWPVVLALLQLVAGAAVLGAVSNGMLLGHWYLNQPGLKPWALARLTQLALGAVAVAALVGVAGAARLTDAVTDDAVLGIPGFGRSFGFVFYVIWLLLLVFTGAVVWMARRCVKIRSIQSATGLYYVALLTAGVSEFLVRYLMVNAS